MWYCRLYHILMLQHLDAWDLPFESPLRKLILDVAWSYLYHTSFSGIATVLCLFFVPFFLFQIIFTCQSSMPEFRWHDQSEFREIIILMACILVIPILLTGFVESIFPLMIALWIFGGSSLIAFAQFFVLNQVFANVQKAENIERA